MNKPFGAYPPGWRLRAARRLSTALGGDPVSRFLRSGLMKLANSKNCGPQDVTIFDDQKARLNPVGNICEKRVLFAPGQWEPLGRKTLSDAIENHTGTHFRFVDAGANVGLFSLYAHHCALKTDKTLSALAIEPGVEMQKRLAFNIENSKAQHAISILPFGLSDHEGTSALSLNMSNLGESQISKEGSQVIQVRPLYQLIKNAAWTRIDALKIDIEGAEHRVLAKFFADAPPNLHPALIIMEIAHDHEGKLDSLCTKYNYYRSADERGNAVYQLG